MRCLCRYSVRFGCWFPSLSFYLCFYPVLYGVFFRPPLASSLIHSFVVLSILSVSPLPPFLLFTPLPTFLRWYRKNTSPWYDQYVVSPFPYMPFTTITRHFINLTYTLAYLSGVLQCCVLYVSIGSIFPGFLLLGY